MSRHFPLGKDELFVGTCGKIMGNDGQIWEKMGRYGIMMGKLKYLLGGWWFAPVFVAYNVS